MTIIEFSPIPSQSELLALQHKLANTPEGGAVVLIAALLAWAHDDPRAEMYLSSALACGQLECGQIRLIDRQRLARQYQGRRSIIHSYIEGATSENCSGAATPRPVTLKRESDGLWRGYEWSSLLTGVAAPR